MADFAADLSAFVAKANAQSLLAFRGIAMEIEARLRELTPVDIGFLRAAWTASPVPGIPTLSRPAGRTEAAAAAAVLAGTTAEESAAVIGAAVLGETIYILNPAEYARFIEYGTSRMAGRGMVAQTVAESQVLAEGVLVRIQP